MEQVVDDCLGISGSEKALPLEVSLPTILETATGAIVENGAARLSEHVWQALEKPGRRAVQARRAAMRMSNMIGQLVQEVTDLHQQTRTDLRCLEQEFAKPTISRKDSPSFSRDPSSLAQGMSRYGTLRFQEWIANCAKRVLVRIAAKITELATGLYEIQQEFVRISSEFQAHFVDEQKASCYGVAEEQRLVSRLILRRITADLSPLRNELEQLLQRELEAQSTTLRDLLERDVRHGMVGLQSLVNQAARTVVRERLRQIDLDQLFKDARTGEAEIAGWLQRELEASMPRILSRTGGAARLLVAVPEQSCSNEIAKCLEAQFNENPTIVQATRGDVVVCCEVEQVPLVAVATSLIQSRPDCVDLVTHLHTRTDVSWTPLVCPE